MAGIQWKGGKLTLGKFVATQRHNAKEERVERSHRNAHIDPDKTPDNWSALGLDFRERVARLNARLDEIDVGRKSIGKNERVVAQSLIAYCPPEVVEAGDDAMHRFFDGFWDICSERFGAENLVDMDVHVDEVHEYVDPITHEVVESRPHCHLTFVPCVSTLRKRIEEPVMQENPETGEMEPVRNKNGKIKRRTVGFEDVTLDKPRLNAAQVACRDNIDGLNKAVDEMCVREFGVHYVTGKGTHKSRTVEELKIASAKAAAELADREEQRRLDAAAKANAAQKAAEAAESGRQAAEEARAKAEAERDAMEGDKFVDPEDGKQYLGLAGVSSMLRKEGSKAKAAMERRKELEAQNAELTSKNDELADEVRRTRARHKAMAEAIVKIQAELDATEARRKAATKAADAADAARARADEARREAESATKAAEAQRVEIENARQRAQETLQAVEKQKQALEPI